MIRHYQLSFFAALCICPSCRPTGLPQTTKKPDVLRHSPALWSLIKTSAQWVLDFVDKICEVFSLVLLQTKISLIISWLITARPSLTAVCTEQTRKCVHALRGERRETRNNMHRFA